MEMRRKELAVTDPKELDEIILSCDCLRLALPDGDYPYIVPLNFGYSRQNGQTKFYIHSAGAGKKIDLMRSVKRGSFELDTQHRLKTGEQACNYAMAYRSVTGRCQIAELTTAEEKAAGLQVIMSHYSERSDWTFSPATLEKTCVFCMTVSELNGRKYD